MNIKRLRKTLKKYEFLFSAFRKITDRSFRVNYIDYLKHKKVKSKKIRKRELSLIKNYWKCDPMIYYKYRLFERDLTTEQLLDFVPPYFFYNIYMPSIYPDGKAFEIASSKIRQNDFFVSRHISTPVKLATLIGGKLYDRNGAPLNFKNLLSAMNASGSRYFFMKPDDGRGGKGVCRFEKSDNVIKYGNNILDQSLFFKLARNTDVIIQEGIVQRSDFMNIYPHSVNTLRTVTQNFNGRVKIIAVVLRMGRKGNYVDNASSGGIYVFVDPVTGILSPQAQSQLDIQAFKEHPDTGFRFEGYQIPGWENIRQSILKVASSAPDLPDVAWDITVTEKGIMVVEFNLFYGIDILQRSIGGMRRKLNISPSLTYARVEI